MKKINPATKENADMFFVTFEDTVKRAYEFELEEDAMKFAELVINRDVDGMSDMDVEYDCDADDIDVDTVKVYASQCLGTVKKTVTLE